MKPLARSAVTGDAAAAAHLVVSVTFLAGALAWGANPLWAVPGYIGMAVLFAALTARMVRGKVVQTLPHAKPAPESIEREPPRQTVRRTFPLLVALLLPWSALILGSVAYLFHLIGDKQGLTHPDGGLLFGVFAAGYYAGTAAVMAIRSRAIAEWERRHDVIVLSKAFFRRKRDAGPITRDQRYGTYFTASARDASQPARLPEPEAPEPAPPNLWVVIGGSWLMAVASIGASDLLGTSTRASVARLVAGGVLAAIGALLLTRHAEAIRQAYGLATGRLLLWRVFGGALLVVALGAAGRGVASLVGA